MKGKLTALLALCVLLLTACAVREPPPQLRPLVPGEGEARYSAHTAEGAEKAFPSGDSYLYAVPKLGVENFAALGAEEQKKAVGNTTAFNEKMERVLEDAVARGRPWSAGGRSRSAAPPGTTA